MLVKKSKDGKAPSREKNLLDRSTSRWEDFFHKARSTSAWEKRWPKAKKKRQSTGKKQIEIICILLQSVVFCRHFLPTPTPPAGATSATPQRYCRAWPGGWRRGRCGGLRGEGLPPPRAGAGEPGGPEGTASRPRRVPRLPPGGVDRGAG